MKRQDYYPGDAENQVLWLGHFASELPAHASDLRITDEVLADAIADALWVAYALGPWRTAVRAFAKAATAAIETVQTGTGHAAAGLPALTLPPADGVAARPPGALRRVFRLVQAIKAQPGCTKDVARQLGLLTLADDREHPAPSLEAVAERGAAAEFAVLKMEKWDRPALCIEGCRGGGGWEKLGITTGITFTDDRHLLDPARPEIREYRARYFEDSAPTGDYSPVAKITLSP